MTNEGLTQQLYRQIADLQAEVERLKDEADGLADAIERNRNSVGRLADLERRHDALRAEVADTARLADEMYGHHGTAGRLRAALDEKG